MAQMISSLMASRLPQIAQERGAIKSSSRDQMLGGMGGVGLWFMVDGLWFMGDG